ASEHRQYGQQAPWQQGIISDVSFSSLFDRLKKTTLKATCDALLSCVVSFRHRFRTVVLPGQEGTCCKCWYDRFGLSPSDGSLAALNGISLFGPIRSRNSASQWATGHSP